MAKKTKELCEHQIDATTHLGLPEIGQPAALLEKPSRPDEIPRIAKWINSRSWSKQLLSYIFSSQDDRDRAKATVTSTSDVSATSKVSKCDICAEDARKRRKYRWTIILTLLVPNFMNSLDLTIIATAVPFIASDFNRITQLSWIVNAFTLTSTAFVPSYGQFSDVFGRHGMLQFALLSLLLGSLVCALAKEYSLFLFGRSVQGIGFAGIATLTKIILSDKVSLKENSTNNTIFVLLNGVSYGAGPAIGGFLTQVDWRWCFWINIPMCVFAQITVYFFMRKELLGPQPQTRIDNEGNKIIIERHSLLDKLSVIDYGGTAIFLIGSCLFILALLWGGADHPWASPQVLVPLILGSLLIATFFYYEHLMEPGNRLAKIFPNQDAMVPWSLLRQRDIGVLSFLNFSTGMALFSAFYFVSVYFTIVEGYPPWKAGIQLLYYTPGLGFGAYLAMFLCNVWPRQTWLPMFFGSWIEPIGLALLTYALTIRHVPMINGFLALSGVGTGVRFMPGTLHAVGMEPKRIAQVVSLMGFVLPLGGTLGLTMMGSVFNNEISKGYAALGAGKAFSGHDTGRSDSSIAELQSLPPFIRAMVEEVTKKGVVWAYVAIIPIIALGGVANCFLGNVQITSTSLEDLNKDDKKGEIIDEPYLYWLLKNRRRLGNNGQPTVLQSQSSDAA